MSFALFTALERIFFVRAEKGQWKISLPPSISIEEKLKGRYPLEATQILQGLSSSNSIAHAIASTYALEDYLKINAGKEDKFRQILLLLSFLHAHLFNFYHKIFPLYGFHGSLQSSRFFPGFPKINKRISSQTLSQKDTETILSHFSELASVLSSIQYCIAKFGGKFPVVMNLFPGGVSNDLSSLKYLSKVIHKLGLCKDFIEKTYPEDVKLLIKSFPSLQEGLNSSNGYFSVGFSNLPSTERKQNFYTSGAFLENKLEPFDTKKVTRFTFESEESFFTGDVVGARYHEEPMYTGPLARMMTAYQAGVYPEVSEALISLIDALGLPLEKPYSFASRAFAEVYETRLLLKELFQLLLDNSFSFENRKKEFSFDRNGDGEGRVESPTGAIIHKVKIKDGVIENYEVVSPSNWNLSPKDQFNRKSIVESELDQYSGSLDENKIFQILASYSAHSMEFVR